MSKHLQTFLRTNEATGNQNPRLKVQAIASSRTNGANKLSDDLSSIATTLLSHTAQQTQDSCSLFRGDLLTRTFNKLRKQRSINRSSENVRGTRPCRCEPRIRLSWARAMKGGTQLKQVTEKWATNFFFLSVLVGSALKASAMHLPTCCNAVPNLFLPFKIEISRVSNIDNLVDETGNCNSQWASVSTSDVKFTFEVVIFLFAPAPDQKQMFDNRMRVEEMFRAAPFAERTYFLLQNLGFSVSPTPECLSWCC